MAIPRLCIAFLFLGFLFKFPKFRSIFWVRQSTESKTYLLLVVGNLTIDEVVFRGGRRIQAGGAALYTPVAAAKMGLRAGVISNVGCDYQKEPLDEMRTLAVDVTHVKILQDALTTRFRLDYTGDERRLSLMERCRPMEPQDLHNIRAEAAHIAPVFDEVPAETVLELSERCLLLSFDPQGYVRQVTKDRVVGPRRWFDTQILSHIKVFKSSVEELQWITGTENPWKSMEEIRNSGPDIVVATQGSKGALMLAEGSHYYVPAFPTHPVDPTGAGDAFIGGFLSQHLHGQDAPWSASVGASLASLLIETAGCRIDASIREIGERANWVHGRIKRL